MNVSRDVLLKTNDWACCSIQSYRSLAYDVNAGQQSGFSALTIAARNGHSGIVKLLIEHGADINHQVVHCMRLDRLGRLRSGLNCNLNACSVIVVLVCPG